LRAALIQTGNLAEAEDLAQETFLKAFRAMDTFRAETNAKAWLLTILRNTRIDRFRAAAGSERHVSLEELAAEPADERLQGESDLGAAWRSPQELLSAFSDQDVICALQELADELRWTLLLVDVEEMDHAEAAKVLGVPVGTIKSRAHRGRALLRRALLPIARERRLVRD
jgi:RNA polymerase sigma-70 factor (ECF subfamily)